MKRAFLIGFAVVMLITVALLALRGSLISHRQTPAPPRSIESVPLGPSLMSPSPTPEEDILPPLGLEDRIVAESNIESILAIGMDAAPLLRKHCQAKKMLERHDALLALFKLSSTLASPVAIKMLDDPEPEIQILALAVCAKTGNKKAIERTTELLNSPDSMVRAIAVRAIAHLRQKEALSLITEKLKDNAAVVRQATIEAIEAITYQTFNFSHSGYQTQQEQALKQLEDWITLNRRYSRFEWLERKVLDSIKGLESEDPWERYDSNVFLQSILGETDYSWDMTTTERAEAAKRLTKKWNENVPIFKVSLPLNLYMEIQ